MSTRMLLVAELVSTPYNSIHYIYLDALWQFK